MRARLGKTVYTTDKISKGAVRKMGCTNSLVSIVRLMIGPNSWKLAFNHIIVLTGFCMWTQNTGKHIVVSIILVSVKMVTILRTTCQVAYAKYHPGNNSHDTTRQQQL